LAEAQPEEIDALQAEFAQALEVLEAERRWPAAASVLRTWSRALRRAGREQAALDVLDRAALMASWIRPAGRRAALAAEAPRRLGRHERRLAWGEVEGRPCDGNRPPYLEAAWVTWRASLIPFTLPRPHSSAEARKVLSPSRIRADTCYLVYKAHGRFDRAQKGSRYWAFSC